MAGADTDESDNLVEVRDLRPLILDGSRVELFAAALAKMEARVAGDCVGVEVEGGGRGLT